MLRKFHLCSLAVRRNEALVLVLIPGSARSANCTPFSAQIFRQDRRLGTRKAQEEY